MKKVVRANRRGGLKMKMQEIREIAEKMGVKAGRMDKTKLVRAIQKVEGNYECFSTPYVHECNQINCLWREDCVKAVRP